MSRRLGSGLLLAFTAVALIGAFLLTEDSDEAPETEGGAASPAVGRAVAQAGCASAAQGSSPPPRRGDVVFDLFVLMGARRMAGRRPDAFEGHGYKVPATLPWGVTATLSVPRALRSHVGLVYSLSTQDAVLAEGVEGADSAVRFTSCPTGGEVTRTGWPGGLVVDRPRCAPLEVAISGRGKMRRRVPLGRPC